MLIEIIFISNTLHYCFMKICLGGTFDRFHKGHKALIKKAFEIAGKNGYVFIGITRGDLTKKRKRVRNYEERENIVKKHILKYGFFQKFNIEPIEDKYGPTLDEDFDAIVVSPETRKTAEEINEIRKSKGKKPLKIVEISYVLAKDGKPISSTRIINGEIDEEGNIL